MPATLLRSDQVRHLDVPDGRIAYYVTGATAHTAPVIVWVHGLPLDSRSWAAQQEYFDTRARNVFLDLRGYGASSKLPAAVPSITALYVADLAALIEHLRLTDPMLVGFASAGHVALRLAAEHPHLVGKLAVINGSPKFRRSADWPYGFDEKGIAHFTDAAAERGIEGITDAVLDPELAFADVDAARAAELGAWFREMSHNAGVRSLLGFFENISLDDDRALLPAIKAPTLLMASTIGQEVPTGVSLYLRTAIGRARLAELPGADHFAFATRPELVNSLLDSFLTS
ncbi:alpha/beta fold hydrolase [Streptomyces sp. GbtcB6]|uniref:alpha/beta fold hydrolase n=1 Tax=Streptomyces sp. GbtcB6 TaxID=2824751 RepID=UPI001C3059FA|nr:alpha/beta hydrolase [Streptomyces sp. GbtcB6]